MTIFNKYKLIILFVLLTLIGLGSYYVNPQGFLWKLYDVLGIATTIALAVIAFMGYVEYLKGEDSIKIYLKNDNNKIDTKLSVLRKNCTRGEILGILRMLQKDQGQYILKDIQENKNILKVFDDIQTGKKKELIIRVTQEELKQFSLPA